MVEKVGIGENVKRCFPSHLQIVRCSLRLRQKFDTVYKTKLRAEKRENSVSSCTTPFLQREPTFKTRLPFCTALLSFREPNHWKGGGGRKNSFSGTRIASPPINKKVPPRHQRKTTRLTTGGQSFFFERI